MIDDDSKYFCLSGDIPVGGPSTWHVTDWDQRRVVSVTMDGEQDDESIAIEHFSRYSSQLSPDIYRIYVSHAGEIISTYTDPKDDPTCCVYYPLLHESFFPEGIQIQTVRRDELEELERLGPDVDLVSYLPCLGASAKKEMNLWMRLPRHPNIVPFDRIVVDELEGRVVGFTSTYVPGGSLEENKSRVFRLEWLKQLIKVVDDLNLRYSISHQDIAPRNIVVDESTDSVMLLDFNFAARINHPSSPGEGESYLEDRNDVKGVIFTTYEIITRDNSLRSRPHEEQNLGDLRLDSLEWAKHPEVKLDHPAASYQLILREWRERRAGDLNAVDPDRLPDAIDWPSLPKPPQKTISNKGPHGQLSLFTVDMWDERRQDVRDRGDKVLSWERPPQTLLHNGTRVLASGEVINCSN
ncbi:protein kinase-like protein [Pochonia chlamydosporia 170]|uniref:EKC/KEOPS complex subunit BUD32 n=1 Tax=Pochonia chlamydosporia 170 TaxID=1380566 RepID=A0A179F0X3_METCM|nr:protein kinase-like protein [Pochonia chlamydosporia 170]OAQ58733.1 protein kinase-like protein [Pochonia chlamydosporia 170]